MRRNRRKAAGAAAAALAAMVLALAPAAPARAAGWAVQKEETVRKTFNLGTAGAAAGGRKVEVDNFSGAVRVRGGRAGGEVTLSVHETWGADSAEKLAAGQREMRLEITETAGRLRLFVDGPFRSRDGRGTHFHGWERLGYEAKFDFELEVPADVDLVASTVNGGEVRVSGIGGRFEASNVNGAITLERMGGAGKARTVNGPLTASFTRNPAAGCSFETVNGPIEATFQADLAADLRFRTLNGEVYSDYDYTYRPLPPDPQPAERAHGRYHYRSHGEIGARVAAGGPELAFKTVNGDILIRRQGA
jgi:opacity protein-like surface antigen